MLYYFVKITVLFVALFSLSRLFSLILFSDLYFQHMRFMMLHITFSVFFLSFLFFFTRKNERKIGWYCRYSMLSGWNVCGIYEMILKNCGEHNRNSEKEREGGTRRKTKYMRHLKVLESYTLFLELYFLPFIVRVCGYI